MSRIAMFAGGVCESVARTRDQIHDWRRKLPAGIGEMSNRMAEARFEIALRAGNLFEPSHGSFVGKPGVRLRVRSDGESRTIKVADHRPRHRSWNGVMIDADFRLQHIHR